MKKSSQKKLLDPIKKSLYGLFIIWLGLLAPLVYSDRFAATHRVQPYRFALFQGRQRVPIVSPGTIVAPQLLSRLRQRLFQSSDVISSGSAWPTLAHSLQWSLGQVLLGASLAGSLLLFFGRFPLNEPLSAVSVELFPPKKPPRL